MLRRYLVLIWQESVSSFGGPDLVLGLVGVGGAQLLGWLDVISSSLANTASLVIGALSLGLFALVVLVRSPFRVWSVTRDELDRLTEAAVVAVSPVPPVPLSDGSMLVRLQVESQSAGLRDFAVVVTAVEGVHFGPEAPWFIPWRHDTGRRATLYPRVPEFIDVGRLDPVRFIFDVVRAEDDGKHTAPATFEPGAEIVQIEATIWEVPSGVAAQHFKLEVPTSPNPVTGLPDFTVVTDD